MCKIKAKKMVMMKASEIWKNENAKKYSCPLCGYCTHNKSLFKRHTRTINHWLRTEIFHAPRDLKMLIATYLPFRDIKYCGDIMIDACNYKLPKSYCWRFTKDRKGLLFQISDVGAQIKHKTQNLIYGRLLL